LGRLNSAQGNASASDRRRPVLRDRSIASSPARADSDVRGSVGQHDPHRDAGHGDGTAVRDATGGRLPLADGRRDSLVDLNRRISLAGGVVFLVFACVYFLLSDNLPPGGPFDKIGTKFFPKLLAGILGGLSLLLIVLTVVITRPQDETAPAERGDRPAFYGTLAVAFLALGLWKVVGFLATPLLMAGVMLVNGARSPRVVAAVAIGGTVLLYLVFFRLFALPLPLGLLE